MGSNIVKYFVESVLHMYLDYLVRKYSLMNYYLFSLI